MTDFTTKQRSFIANKAAGMKNKEAAVAAGYAPTSAEVAASKLMVRPDIKKAIKLAREKGVTPETVNLAVENPTPDKSQQMPKAKYTDSKEWLMDAMNHTGLPLALRGDYAKALLPYQHGRIGEKGKKEKQSEAAAKVAGKGKFQPKTPPGSNVVSIGGRKT